MKIVNPYEGVNFGSALRVRSTTHEHIFDRAAAERCYNRGLRVFANVNYTPAVPSLKMSSWNRVYKDWADVYDDTTLLNNGVVDANGKPDFSKTDYFTEVSYQGSIPTISDYFTSAEINTDLIPQIANAEHTDKPFAWGNTSYAQHHNVLGGIWNDVGVLSRIGNTDKTNITFRRSHPLYSVAEENAMWQTPTYQQFSGKIFGTLNHNSNVEGVMPFQKYATFKAMELFNQGYSPKMQEYFRLAYDTALRRGYRLLVASVADWQGSVQTYGGLTPQEKAQFTDVNDYNRKVENGEYVKECNYIRGCNVLLVGSDYGELLGANSQEAETKAEYALDTYIAGKYYASGFGNHYVTHLDISGDRINVGVAAMSLAEAAPKILVSVNEASTNVWVTTFTPEAATTPSSTVEKAKVITNRGTIEFGNLSELSYLIQPGDTYVRFEFYFADKDFLFMNPIWIEDNDPSIAEDAFAIGVI